MTLFFFFQSTRTDQNSSKKFFKILLHQIAPFGLANRTKKVFPVFPRNIPYPARPKVPPFNFFRHCETFFSEIFPQRVPLQIVRCFATEWMLKNPKGSPLSIFFGTARLFSENLFFSPKGLLFNCDKNVENSGSVPLLARQGLALAGRSAPLGSFFGFSIFEYCKLKLGSLFAIFEPWIWRRLGPVQACSYLTLQGILTFVRVTADLKLYARRFKLVPVLGPLPLPSNETENKIKWHDIFSRKASQGVSRMRLPQFSIAASNRQYCDYSPNLNKIYLHCLALRNELQLSTI